MKEQQTLVPTGMNTGVLTLPWIRDMIPTLAFVVEHSFINLKFSGVVAGIVVAI